MNTNTPISEKTADALYDAATAQYAHQTLKLLRREYDLASPREQEAIDNLIERGAQIVFNSDLPEAYVTVDQWIHRLPIIPENWMLALHRGLADGYMVNVVRHLNGE